MNGTSDTKRELPGFWIPQSWYDELSQVPDVYVYLRACIQRGHRELLQAAVARRQRERLVLLPNEVKPHAVP